MSSRYFGFINGKPYDFKFIKHKVHKGWYKFYLGEHFLGNVIKNTYGRNSEANPSWSVIVYGDSANYLIPTQVDGFKTRHYAVDYLLKAHELTRKNYNTQLRDNLMFNRGDDDEDHY